MSRRQDQSSSRLPGVALRIAEGQRGRVRLSRAARAPDRVSDQQRWVPPTEMFKIGDAVETAVDLPGIPRGSSGRVREIEPLLIAVEFDEGRIGYYSPRQLRRVLAPPDSPQPPTDR